MLEDLGVRGRVLLLFWFVGAMLLGDMLLASRLDPSDQKPRDLYRLESGMLDRSEESVILEQYGLHGDRQRAAVQSQGLTYRKHRLPGNLMQALSWLCIVRS